MWRAALVIFVGIAPLAVVPALAQAVVIPTELAERDYYPWITALSAGPIAWTGAENTDVAGYYFRAVVTTSEVYSDLYIEYMTLGDEGCCKRVAWARHMITEEFTETFGIRGEFAGLLVDEWRETDALVVIVQRRRFLLALGTDGDLTAEEIQKQ